MHRDPPLSREGMLALCERALNVDLPAAELDAVFPDGEPTDPSRNRLYWDLVDGVEHVPGYLSGGVDPKSGRFTQEDPIGIAGGLNVYGFANGDPVTYSDPYGLSAQCRPWPQCSSAAWREAAAESRRQGRHITAGVQEIAGDAADVVNIPGRVWDWIREKASGPATNAARRGLSSRTNGHSEGVISGMNRTDSISEVADTITITSESGAERFTETYRARNRAIAETGDAGVRAATHGLSNSIDQATGSKSTVREALRRGSGQ